MTPGHFSRTVRAATFAALCVLLAATGHVLMSGTPVPGWVIGLALVSTAAFAWSLAGTERGLLGVTTAAVAVQAALHAGFSLTQAVRRSFAHQRTQYLPCGETGRSASEAACPVGDAGLGGTAHQAPGDMSALTDAGAHIHHAPHGVSDTLSGAVAGAAVPDGHAMAGVALSSPSGMLAAHLLAAVLAGLWLACGEQAAFRLLRTFAARLWTPWLLLVVPSRLPRRAPRRARRRRERSSLRQLLLIHVITSRGPPAGTAVV
ncbi:hypothetical protein ACFCZ1_36545 [Streptomyces sp. NPDC056224]|uniref:hypothetical protein n=1 Tax=Streptomyces sp. NPDC056224 TaxID=3345750 RepID=UPI0035D82C0A